MRYYENPKVFCENRLPQRSYYIPYESLEKALSGNRHHSAFYRLLNGQWDFTFFQRDFDLPEDEEDFNDLPEQDKAENWYKFLGRDILTDVITDLNTRGFKRMEITEDGEIRVNDTTEEQIDDFPETDGWNTLVAEMANDGLNARIADDRLVVTW